MIRFQTQSTRLPTRSAVGRPDRIKTAAFVASVALTAQILSACSIVPESASATSAVAQYPDLNDVPPRAEVRADQVARIEAELIQVRDDQERAATLRQGLH